MGKTTDVRKTYKPLDFPWALEICEKQHSMHWLPGEISMTNDVQDYQSELNVIEKDIINNILRFFTQIDVEVGRAYIEYMAPIFKCPEIRMMLISFASMETIHVISYSHLLTSLMLPDSEYSVFLKYKEMLDKYEYMQSFNTEDAYSVALTIAQISAFVEGIVLFSSFTILMYFSLKRKKKCLLGVGQIVSFAIRDETLHCISVAKLFRQYVEENKESINVTKLSEDIYSKCHKIIEMEFAFIDLCFKNWSLEDLTKEELKSFLLYIADIRLKQIGLNPIFGYKENPLPWTNNFLFPKELGNFFEVGITNYTKASFINEDNLWEDN